MSLKKNSGNPLRFQVTKKEKDKFGNFKIYNGKGNWQCTEEDYNSVQVGDTVSGTHTITEKGYWQIDNLQVEEPKSSFQNISQEAVAEGHYKLFQLETDVAEIKKIMKQAFPATKESAIQTIHMIMLKWDISPDDLGIV